MNINPTSTRRTVVIEIQTGITGEALHNLKAAAGTEVITSIQLIADDGMQVIEAVFSATMCSTATRLSIASFFSADGLGPGV